ncbi:MAG TPA: UbiA prenyltransferase family protein [Candidatus Saccharimonadales bacterium]|nr:UbiA prenyltransferase family protein [Candidatus Saccharimonadales bacterium]
MAKYEFTSKGPGLIWFPFWLFVSARPRQWLKNLALFAPLVFAGEFFNPVKFSVVFFGFLIFCLVTSSIYIVNDVIDMEKDRAHPYKNKRPIAGGKLAPGPALVCAVLMIGFAILIANQLSTFFTLAVAAYAILQVVYSLFLRSVILIDVMAIASGFLLRVYAGGVLINAHVTVWFMLTVASVALFLAIGKRRSERTLLSAIADNSMQTRKILHHYPESLLDSLTVMFATASWLSYTMFTFLQPPPSANTTVMFLFGSYLPRTFLSSKWLMASVPFVIYGVMRYLYVIYEKKEGESPERVLLSDAPLLIAVMVWVFVVFAVIYGSALIPERIMHFFQ